MGKHKVKVTVATVWTGEYPSACQYAPPCAVVIVSRGKMHSGEVKAVRGIMVLARYKKDDGTWKVFEFNPLAKVHTTLKGGTRLYCGPRAFPACMYTRLTQVDTEE